MSFCLLIILCLCYAVCLVCLPWIISCWLKFVCLILFALPISLLSATKSAAETLPLGPTQRPRMGDLRWHLLIGPRQQLKPRMRDPRWTLTTAERLVRGQEWGTYGGTCSSDQDSSWSQEWGTHGGLWLGPRGNLVVSHSDVYLFMSWLFSQLFIMCLCDAVCLADPNCSLWC